MVIFLSGKRAVNGKSAQGAPQGAPQDGTIATFSIARHTQIFARSELNAVALAANVAPLPWNRCEMGETVRPRVARGAFAASASARIDYGPAPPSVVTTSANPDGEVDVYCHDR
jgi:hypothetical protein